MQGTVFAIRVSEHHKPRSFERTQAIEAPADVLYMCHWSPLSLYIAQTWYSKQCKGPATLQISLHNQGPRWDTLPRVFL